MCQPDGSHTSLAEGRVEGVGAYALAGQRTGWRQRPKRPGFEKTLCIELGIQLQEATHLLRGSRLCCFEPYEPTLAFLRRQVQRLIQKRCHLGPTCRGSQ